MERNYDSLVNRLNQLEERIASGAITISNGNAPQENNVKAQEISTAPEVLPDAIPEEIMQVVQNWNQIISKVGEENKLAQTYLRSATPALGSGNQLQLLFQDAVDKGCIDKEETFEQVTQIISKIIGKQIQIITRVQEGATKVPSDAMDLSKFMDKVEVVYED